MKIQFLEKKLNLPGSVRAYAEKKVTKLDRYSGMTRRHLSLLVWKRTAILWS